MSLEDDIFSSLVLCGPCARVKSLQNEKVAVCPTGCLTQSPSGLHYEAVFADVGPIALDRSACFDFVALSANVGGVGFVVATCSASGQLSVWSDHAVPCVETQLSVTDGRVISGSGSLSVIALDVSAEHVAVATLSGVVVFAWQRYILGDPLQGHACQGPLCPYRCGVCTGFHPVDGVAAINISWGRCIAATGGRSTMHVLPLYEGNKLEQLPFPEAPSRVVRVGDVRGSALAVATCGTWHARSFGQTLVVYGLDRELIFDLAAVVVSIALSPVMLWALCANNSLVAIARSNPTVSHVLAVPEVTPAASMSAVTGGVLIAVGQKVLFIPGLG